MARRIIAPSLLAADFGRLNEEVSMLNGSAAEWLHLDIMDGVFVPNISYGFPVVKAIRRQSPKVLDVHLMIVDPDRYLDAFCEAGADYLTVHVEACPHLHRTLQRIRALGMKAGVALNPHTPLCMIEEVLCGADMVMLMSVNPGFGGQKFIPESVDKVRRLRGMLDAAGSEARLQVDGGVSLDNARELFDSGADVLVTGSSVFSAPNPQIMIQKLIKIE